MMLSLLHYLFLAVFTIRAIANPTYFNHETGIEIYYSRPDIRPQILQVTTYEPDLVAPGYFFTAPYHFLVDYKGRFTPGQPGPHIYDQQGDLVWSGAAKLTGSGSAFDFRPAQYNGSSHLSFVDFRNQGYVIMDNSYDIVKSFKPKGGLLDDLHEFHIIEDTNHALVTTVSRQPANMSLLNRESDQMVISHGFQEVNLETEEAIFQWNSIDHIPLNDSYVTELESDGYFDFAHANSVQKTADGDYIVSVRHMCAIYKISGKDGSILWQLGGKRSTFDTTNFELAYQHDARLHEETDTHMIISVFNNGADDRTRVLNHSSALLLRADKVTLQAEEVASWPRPDEQISTHRGNVQFLSNGNVFVCWSAGGYASEFTRDGKLVQEIHFQTDRMGTYRTYKAEFHAADGLPERPTLKAFVDMTPSPYGNPSTSFFVSWNGATEVSSFNVYSVDQDNQVTPLGSMSRDGFETSLILGGHFQFTFVEALSSNGSSLGNSTIEVSQPAPWPSSLKTTHHDQLLRLRWTPLGGGAMYPIMGLIEIASMSFILGALLTMSLSRPGSKKLFPTMRALFAFYGRAFLNWHRHWHRHFRLGESADAAMTKRGFA